MNSEPIILHKKIEDLREVGALMSVAVKARYFTLAQNCLRRSASDSGKPASAMRARRVSR